MTRLEQINMYIRVIDDTLVRKICISESAKIAMIERKENLERELKSLTGK